MQVIDTLFLEQDQKQEQETEIPDMKFPRDEPFEIAVHECRIYDSQGRRIQVIPAKRIQEVLAEVYTEPTYRERVQSKKPAHPWNTPQPIPLPVQ